MKKTVLSLITLLLGVFLIQACGGPSEDQLRQKEQARLDSLEQVRISQQVRDRADKEARQLQDQKVAEQRELDRIDREMREIRYSETGKLTVQVDSWRSLELAKAALDTWKQRGFDNAYLVEWGEPDTGEVWYRLRIGRFASPRMAERLQYVLSTDYSQVSWIDNYQDLPRVNLDQVREAD